MTAYGCMHLKELMTLNHKSREIPGAMIALFRYSQLNYKILFQYFFLFIKVGIEKLLCTLLYDVLLYLTLLYTRLIHYTKPCPNGSLLKPVLYFPRFLGVSVVTGLLYNTKVGNNFLLK